MTRSPFLLLLLATLVSVGTLAFSVVDHERTDRCWEAYQPYLNGPGSPTSVGRERIRREARAACTDDRRATLSTGVRDATADPYSDRAEEDRIRLIEASESSSARVGWATWFAASLLAWTVGMAMLRRRTPGALSGLVVGSAATAGISCLFLLGDLPVGVAAAAAIVTSVVVVGFGSAVAAGRIGDGRVSRVVLGAALALVAIVLVVASVLILVLAASCTTDGCGGAVFLGVLALLALPIGVVSGVLAWRLLRRRDRG